MSSTDESTPSGSSKELTVNGETRAVVAANVRDLVVELGLDPEGRGIAVAVEDAVVPRGSWRSTRLSDGDRVEIVGAVQGG